MNMCHNDKQEDISPPQQIQGIWTVTQQRQVTNSRTDMSDSKQDCVMGGDAPKNITMNSSQNSTKVRKGWGQYR